MNYRVTVHRIPRGRAAVFWGVVAVDDGPADDWLDIDTMPPKVQYHADGRRWLVLRAVRARTYRSAQQKAIKIAARMFSRGQTGVGRISRLGALRKRLAAEDELREAFGR